MAKSEGYSARTIHWIEGALAKLGKVTILGLLLAGFSLYIFTLIIDELMEGGSIWLDTTIVSDMHQIASPTLNFVAQALSLMGAQLLGVIIVLALLIMLYQRRWGSALLLVIGTIGAQILNSLLKVFVHRTRPTEIMTSLPGQDWSFPSGHAMVSLVAYGLLAAFIWTHVDRRHKAFWVTVLVILVTLIGLSRIYLTVHYFSDVIGGYLAGTIWLITLLVGSNEVTRIRGSMKRGIPPPDPQEPAKSG